MIMAVTMDRILPWIADATSKDGGLRRRSLIYLHIIIKSNSQELKHTHEWNGLKKSCSEEKLWYPI
jgi:hypothetical protein